MSVQISELDVITPPRAQSPQQPGQGGAQGGGGAEAGGQGSGAPSPALAQEVARTVAISRSRDLRLHAD
ncbi:MAG TPA: hypothetical protein VMB53_15915 [Gaiellaceae bacterium]|nr:hypothetical protein [Gaiellaceae bacterium]